MERSRLVLANEHVLFLEGLQRILESDFDIVGVAVDGRDLVELVLKLRPDLVVTETALPLLSGTEAVIRFKKVLPNIPVLFLTRHSDRQHLSSALQAGGSGYVVKHSSGAEVIVAIREILMGRSYISPLITSDLLSTFRDAFRQSGKIDLTERQREILQLITENHSIKDIASILHISRKTVEYHKYALMRALGFRTNTQLIQYAIDEGICERRKPK
jgi:DNA-binding NarL/FixJ family response regulator